MALLLHEAKFPVGSRVHGAYVFRAERCRRGSGQAQDGLGPRSHRDLLDVEVSM